jgi:hypothetical protein
MNTILYSITNFPLKGNHVGNMDEQSANYLLTFPNGCKLFYGLDTGWYLPKTQVYMTHINQSSTHDELVSVFEKEHSMFERPIAVAYDGMTKK